MTTKKTDMTDGQGVAEEKVKKTAVKKAAAKTPKAETGVKKAAEKKSDDKPAAKKTTAKKTAEKADVAVLDPKNNPDDLVKIVGEVLSEKKAEDIIAINIAERTVVADYFIIASGRSTTSVNALAAKVDEKLSKDYGLEPLHKEGMREGRWIALDYGSVIVHIFHSETRAFYQLERLWTEKASITEFK